MMPREAGRGDTVMGTDEQQMIWWPGAEGSCPVLAADGGFRLIILS